MKYKALVQEIKDLPWHQYDPRMIIYLSWVTAVEFAESLRCAIEAYPYNENLNEMTKGELKTDNLVYGHYNKIGDHHEFLLHFMKNDETTISDVTNSAFHAKKKYLEAVKSLGVARARAMTIFSREQELPDIFKNILSAHDWDSLGFGFYKYYLERHIALDSEDGGHAELTKDFELDEDILEKFYTLRLNLYKSLEN